MIHDYYQGVEMQKHDRNNHVELGKTSIPGETEGIDRSKEPEQKGMRTRKSGKTRRRFITNIELKSIFPELQ